MIRELLKGNTFGFQNRLGNTIDRGIGTSNIYRGQLTSNLEQYKGGQARFRGLLNVDPNLGSFTRSNIFAGAQQEALGQFSRGGLLAGAQRQAFRGLAASESSVLNFANKVNDHLSKTGRGVAGGFQSTGALMSRMPMKHLAKSYGLGTPLMLGLEVAVMGKPLSMSTVAETAWNNIPFTLSMELAGGGVAGVAKGLGYGMLGSAMGLGPWGTLALQVAGSTYLPGLAPTAGIVMGAYQAGKGMYHLHKEMYKLGKGVRKTEFVTGDMSYATAEAATMRQRSVAAIQKSHLNMRSMLGREATILMGR